MATRSSRSVGRTLWLLLLVIYGSVQLHEAGHWLVLECSGRGPTMGFAGLVQRWDTPPQFPDHWQQIQYPEVGIGWMRLQSLPGSHLEWAAMLLAGQMVPLLLIGLGFFLFHRHRWNRAGVVGLMLVFVNGAMGLAKLIGLLAGSKGDLYFLSLHVPMHPTLLSLVFAALQLAGFAWAWCQLPPPRQRLWGGLLVLGYFLIIIPLRLADARLRQLVNLEVNWVQPLFGWSKPVLLVNVLAVGLFALWWVTETAKAEPSG